MYTNDKDQKNRVYLYINIGNKFTQIKKWMINW